MSRRDPLEARNLFPLSEHYIHMNHAGVSPMSQRSAAAVGRVIDASMNRPYPDHWAQDAADRVRELVARLINTAPDTIAITRSTGHGMSLLAQGLEWSPVTTSWVRSESTRPTSIHGWRSRHATSSSAR